MTVRSLTMPRVLGVPVIVTWARSRLTYIAALVSLAGTVSLIAIVAAGVYLPTELLVGALAIFFGIQMKVADLLVDHGLVWFRGADKVLGIGWGLAGSLLILAHPPLANFLIPLVLVCFVREKIDRANHGLATTVMLLAVLLADPIIFAVRSFVGTRFFHESFVSNPTFLTINLELNVAGAFLVVLLVLGLAEDILEKKLDPKWHGHLYELMEQRYWALPLVYSLLSRDWLVFACSALFIKSYELARVSHEGPLRRGWDNEPEIARLTFGFYLAVGLVVTAWLLTTGMAKFSPNYVHSAWDLRQGEYQVFKAERSPRDPKAEVVLTVREGFYGSRAPAFLPTREFKVALPSWELNGQSKDNVGTDIHDAWQMWVWENPWADPPMRVPPGDWLDVRLWPDGFMGWQRHLIAIFYSRESDDPFREKWPSH